MDVTAPIRTTLLCAAVAVGLSACIAPSEQHNGGIIIDRKGVDMQAYQNDLDECKVYAAEVSRAERAAEKGAKGAILGGAIGAIIGNSGTASRGAGVGAVTGGAGGFSQAEREQQRIIRNCLIGRGYRVLN
ncbi:glycine zipper family protein [Pseudomaricurvus alkylphenolicus]|jgi:uncharacterized protein YcfJ|uniref:glycine zipper family protein n=1 Tax=Pseudomaricurvus alkylphenolicus TaxID=1306991 RepID=UPI0014222D09|nr:glycine zipper family protein [Pseudomaricurvus alkylphenolicus]NIB43984.1 glycine zipper family protein [Pseudomaricurvus alkylphenolicus]